MKQLKVCSAQQTKKNCAFLFLYASLSVRLYDRLREQNLPATDGGNTFESKKYKVVVLGSNPFV
jgi:hypothetical protein